MNDRPRPLEVRRTTRSAPVGRGTNNRPLDAQGRPRPFVRDDSWRDRNERRVKGWDRGKTKRKVLVRGYLPDSEAWNEHVAILLKAGVDVYEAERKSMKRLR